MTVDAAATQAVLTNTGIEESNANATINFGVRSDAVLGDITVVAGGITDEVTITFAQDTDLDDGEVVATFDADTNTITVSGNEAAAGTITMGDVAAAIDGLAGFSASAATPADAAGDFSDPGNVPADESLTDGASIEIEATEAGFNFNNVQVLFQAGASTEAVFDATARTLTVTFVEGTDDFDAIAAAIDALDEFSASATSGGASLSGSVDDVATGNTLLTGGGVLLANVVFELVGSNGTETFNFQAGTTNAQIAAAINLVSDATGVTAEVGDDGSLNFNSSAYGSEEPWSPSNVISEGEGGTFESEPQWNPSGWN